MSAENKAVTRRLIDEVWNQRNFDVLDDLFAADALIYDSGVPRPTRGPRCAKMDIGAACAAFPDIRINIDDIFAAEDKVVVRWSSHGTHRGEMQGIPPTNRSLTPQQPQALDTQESAPPRVVDPRTHITYVLVPEVDYEAIRELLEDERRQQAIHAVALRNAAGRMDEAP